MHKLDIRIIATAKNKKKVADTIVGFTVSFIVCLPDHSALRGCFSSALFVPHCSVVHVVRICVFSVVLSSFVHASVDLGEEFAVTLLHIFIVYIWYDL